MAPHLAHGPTTLSQAGGSYPLQSHPGAGHCRRWHELGLVRDVGIPRWGWFEMSARGRRGGWLVRDVGGVTARAEISTCH